VRLKYSNNPIFGAIWERGKSNYVEPAKYPDYNPTLSAQDNDCSNAALYMLPIVVDSAQIIQATE